MENSLDLIRLYRELADGYADRGQPQFRDRFLVLAADTALAAGNQAESERCRHRLLAVNPHHLLKPYASFVQALQAPDVQTYVRDLRQNYPPQVAQGLLRSIQELKEPEENNQFPVTAPLFNLGDGPDLLMDDASEPLRILSLRDDPPSGLPPTLPPNKFPRPPAVGSQARTIPPTLYDAQLPPELPEAPRSQTPRVKRPVPELRPPPRKPPAPSAIPAPRPIPVSPPAAAESVHESSGAWLLTLLFGIVATAALALVFDVLFYPLFFRH